MQRTITAPSTPTIALVIFLAAFLLPSLSYAGSGPVPVPQIEEGTYVYSPDDCAPNGFSRAQQDALNARLRNLHNPFYVVVLCDLPRLDNAQNAYARTNGFRGDSETKRIEVANAMLLEDWSAEQPDAFDPANSGLFVISFKPRKYAWHPSLRAKNELGLNKRGQDQFTQKFTRAAQHRPADYGSGIGNLATAYDEWYYDRTDPVRIAELKEIERQRQAARRLQAAQSDLDAEILHLSNLLNEVDYLPEDVSSYNDALADAKKARRTDDPASMEAEANELRGTVKVLDDYVGERRTEARMAMFLFILKWLGIGGLIGFLVFLIRRRQNAQRELQDAWLTLVGDWDQKVRNAHARWTDHYLDREAILGLDGVIGKTKKLFDETTEQVDGILIRIRAMQQHQATCERLYKRGGFWNFNPYHEALQKFQLPFEFDTGKVNEADLFGATVTLKVNPSNFAAETAALFAASIEGWKRLQAAADARYGEAAEDFPHGNMDLLFEMTAENGIPERWLSSHPLYEDDDSDATFYETLDALRLNDPLAYVEKIESLRKDEAVLMAMIQRFVEMRAEIDRVRVSSAFEAPSKVQASDNPDVTLAAAQQAEDRLAGLLAGAGEEEVQKQAAKVVKLYEKTSAQRAEILSAVRGAQANLDGAKARKREVERVNIDAIARHKEARKVHRNVKPAADAISAAAQFIEEGTRLVEEAEAALQESRHLDARRTAERATKAFQQALSRAQSALDHCDALDAKRAEFETRLARMKDTRSSLARKMRNYGSHSRNLSAFQAPAVSGIVDYAVLLAGLDTQINGWRSTVRNAESDYEDEQRRKRRERERREREERERREAERRRRSSYSSSSSSSFGGGGFGGSGGSFGGGGFGGSSGSF